MAISTENKIMALLKSVSEMDAVKAVGWTGKIEVPRAGESDIDIFVFADIIPDEKERKSAYDKTKNYEEFHPTIFQGGVWGTGDLFVIDGVETELMYFGLDKTIKYVDEVLDGIHPDSVQGFYPVGRLSALKNMSIIYDEANFLKNMKKKLSVYPEKLRKILVKFHTEKAYDAEDFGRAKLRKDSLFYHQALENALDHFLQALYALNKTFFPSRKRTEQYIKAFEYAPKNCNKRILKAIKLGARPNGIAKSQKIWLALVDELKSLEKI